LASWRKSICRRPFGKLGRECRPYVILGACNPPLACSAINADPSVGLLLPRNVTVELLGERRTLVRLTNPQALLSVSALGTSPELAGVARDGGDRMSRVWTSACQMSEAPIAHLRH
jgi:hypothetical protein